MADPICRWRNSSIKQVVEFNTLLPLSSCDKKSARDLVEKRWAILGGKDFFQTPYQLAAQMGLYYEDEQYLHPRFSRLISIEEAISYMDYWGKHYYAPNPYTRSMTETKRPVILNNFLVNWVIDNEKPLFSEALKVMFSESIGNSDILINMINNFTEVKVENDVIYLKDNVSHKQYDNVYRDIDVNDKKGFFEYVGAYKPTTKEVMLRDVSGHIVVENGKAVTEDKIVYEFVEQAFLQAYINAWKKYADAKEGESPKEQYLIIEEINRGNCAQIFGDLFQLLDRNDSGFSDYPVNADNDMAKHLKKALAGLEIADKKRINALYLDEHKDVVSKVLEGDVILLPNNLFIWATMNTSDQSLFPIDSAFKRRWEWKYIPICNAEKGWSIDAGGNTYDWWSFLNSINRQIQDVTSSEDKKLGYFFVNADAGGVISAEKFVGKVAFYLWNDVFKDYGFDGEIFQRESGEPIAFQDFFLCDGKANEDTVERFLKNLGVTAKAKKGKLETEDDPIAND